MWSAPTLSSCSQDNDLLRPGYVRISLPYFADAAALRYVLDAVLFVAEHGWKLLPQYTCDAASAEWRHVHQRRPPRAWLGQISYESGKMTWANAAGSAGAAPRVDDTSEQAMCGTSTAGSERTPRKLLTHSLAAC